MARPKSARFQGSVSRTTAYRLALQYGEYILCATRYSKLVHLLNDSLDGFDSKRITQLASECAEGKRSVIYAAAGLLSAQRLSGIDAIDETVLAGWVSLSEELSAS